MKSRFMILVVFILCYLISGLAYAEEALEQEPLFLGIPRFESVEDVLASDLFPEKPEVIFREDDTFEIYGDAYLQGHPVSLSVENVPVASDGETVYNMAIAVAFHETLNKNPEIYDEVVQLLTEAWGEPSFSGFFYESEDFRGVVSELDYDMNMEDFLQGKIASDERYLISWDNQHGDVCMLMVLQQLKNTPYLLLASTYSI